MKTLLMLIMTMLALAGPPALAQEYASTSTGARGADQAFTPAELDQMLAPIALYLDALLSQVLMASSYPLEVVEAARWSRSNPELEGERAVEAVAEFDWDPSVKGLVAFPDILQKMDEDLDWTRRLGDAFLYQEDELMDRVQFLRDRAYQAGNLESSEYARVVREERIIEIEPAREHFVHVPYYDSRRAYGSWLHPSYPPYYWLPPPFFHVSHGGFFWSHGVGLTPGFFYSSMYWPQHHVVILHAPRHCHSRHRHPHRDYTAGQRWRHDPRHRRGVDYRQPELDERFGRSRASGEPTMTAAPDVWRSRLAADRDRERATPSAGGVRSTLARGVEPTAVAPSGRRGGGGATATALAPAPRVVSDSGAGESRAVRQNRQRAVAAGNRSQNDTSSSGYRSPTTTLTRPH